MILLFINRIFIVDLVFLNVFFHFQIFFECQTIFCVKQDLFRHDELVALKGLYYAMWRQQIGERRSTELPTDRAKGLGLRA